MASDMRSFSIDTSHPSSNHSLPHENSYIKPRTRNQSRNTNFYISQVIIDTVAQNDLKKAISLFSSNDLNLAIIRDEEHQTLLHLVAQNNNYYLFKLLLIKQEHFQPESVSPWVQQADVDGYTPGHYAAHIGNLNILTTYLEHGGDVYARSHKGLNLFHVAAQNNQVRVLAYLKEICGMSPYIKDNKSASALHQASFFGSYETVELLLSWKLEINAQDQDGLTPLHLASMQGHKKIVKKLLKKGANRSIQEAYGKSPLDMATEFNQERIIEVLKDYSRHKCVNSYFYVVLFYLIFGSVVAVEVLYLYPHSPFPWLTYLGITIQAGSFVSFTLCCLIDPGYKKKKQNQSAQIQPLNQTISDSLFQLLEEKSTNICFDCYLIKSKRYKHCSICNKCVRGYDHHCPWMNNCIGKRNFVFFYLFIFFINSLLIYTIAFSCYLLLAQAEECWLPAILGLIIVCAIPILPLLYLLLSYSWKITTRICIKS